MVGIVAVVVVAGLLVYKFKFRKMKDLVESTKQEESSNIAIREIKQQ